METYPTSPKQGEAVGDPLEVARLQIILGNSLVAVGCFQKAIEVLESATATRAARLGADNTDTLLARADLAMAYSNAGHVAESLKEFEGLLVRRLGASEPPVLKVRREHRVAPIAGGRERNAAYLLARVVSDYQAAGLKDNRDTLIVANMLTQAYVAGGQFDPAIDLLNRVIPDCERFLGRDHPDTITARSNMAIACHQAGRFQMALDMQQNAYDLLRLHMAEDHPTTLPVSNSPWWPETPASTRIQ